MSATVQPSNASRSTPHARRDTASHQRPICQRADGARSRRALPSISLCHRTRRFLRTNQPVLPARRRPTVDHSLAAGDAQRQWLQAPAGWPSAAMPVLSLISPSSPKQLGMVSPELREWLLVPGQPDPKGDLVWTDLKLQGQDSLATRAAKKLKNEESLVTQMGGVRLRTELDRIPLWTGNHVSIKQLAEYMARYLYLPRLRDEQVLLAAIQEGVASLMWQGETFAYAEGWDEQRQRYLGLRAGQSMRVVVDDRSLLVKPDVAAAQFDAERQPEAFPTNG